MDAVLVTGGAGFIGSHVADYLLQRGYHVVVVDDLSGGYRTNVPAKAEFFQISLNNAGEVRALFRRHHFRFVYHFAAYAAEGLSHFIRNLNYTTNLLASANLISESVNGDVACFVFASSMAVYGTGRVPFAENDAPRPIDPYGIAKFAVECDLRAASEVFGLPFIIFRPHNVYGERQNLADPYRNVVAIFLRQLLEGRPFTVFGDGQQTRAFTYVEDVVPVIADSVLNQQAHGEVFNIGGDHPCTVLELANLIQHVFGEDNGIEYLPARHEAVNAYCNHDKARRMLAYRDCTPLSTGLSRMIEWARAAALPQYRPGPVLQISKRLPTAWSAAGHALSE